MVCQRDDLPRQQNQYSLTYFRQRHGGDFTERGRLDGTVFGLLTQTDC
jgi:hypothetical protein